MGCISFFHHGVHNKCGSYLNHVGVCLRNSLKIKYFYLRESILKYKNDARRTGPRPLKGKLIVKIS